MVTVVSFNKRLPPAAAKTGRGTLAELMAKEKRFADAKSAAGEIESPTIMQGFGKLANVAVNAMQENRAANDYSEQQGRFRTLMASIDPEKGATTEQLEQSGEFDPDVMMELFKDRRERAQQLADHDRDTAQREFEYQRGIQRDDTVYNRGIQRDDTVDARELGQAIEAETRAVGRELTVNERERLEADFNWQRDVRQRLDEHRQGLSEGSKRVVTGEEAVKLGGDKDRSYVTDASGQTLDDITPTKPKRSVLMSREEIAASPNLDPNLPYRKDLDTGEVQAVGAPPQGQLVSGEIAARLGLMKGYFDTYEKNRALVEGGALSGSNYVTSAWWKSGPGAQIIADIQTGKEALVRNLTGAGMLESEAADYADQYMPAATDFGSKEKILRKMDTLYRNMRNVEAGVSQGRKWDRIVDPDTVPKRGADTDKDGEISPEEAQAEIARRKAAKTAPPAGGR